MLKPKQMLEDDREIESIWFNDELDACIRSDGDTKIIVYGEPGLYGLLPYIAVYRCGTLAQRVPANMVQINYRVEDSAQMSLPGQEVK